MATDYEGSVHRHYAQGRALSPELHDLWIRTFASHLPPVRPLRGLDLGSGTGRFTPHLAEAFGPVTGVEPSDAMRRVAAQVSAHTDVDYVDGCAEDIPTSDAAMDYCLMYLSWHHVLDRTRAAEEIVRVLRPGGLLLCRTQLSDQMPDLWWLRHFPFGPAADAAMYRPLADDLGVFTSAGFEPAPGLTWVAEPSAGTKAERLEKLRTRTLSVLDRMADDDFDAGLASLSAEVRKTPQELAPGNAASLLVMRKPIGRG
jgi:SAM-dependent methyltransferase